MPIPMEHIMTRTFFAQQGKRKGREFEQKRRTEDFTEATAVWSYLWDASVVLDEGASLIKTLEKEL